MATVVSDTRILPDMYNTGILNTDQLKIPNSLSTNGQEWITSSPSSNYFIAPEGTSVGYRLANGIEYLMIYLGKTPTTQIIFNNIDFYNISDTRKIDHIIFAADNLVDKYKTTATPNITVTCNNCIMPGVKPFYGTIDSVQPADNVKWIFNNCTCYGMIAPAYIEAYNCKFVSVGRDCITVMRSGIFKNCYAYNPGNIAPIKNAAGKSDHVDILQLKPHTGYDGERLIMDNCNFVLPATPKMVSRTAQEDGSYKYEGEGISGVFMGDVDYADFYGIKISNFYFNGGGKPLYLSGGGGVQANVTASNVPKYWAIHNHRKDKPCGLIRIKPGMTLTEYEALSLDGKNKAYTIDDSKAADDPECGIENCYYGHGGVLYKAKTEGTIYDSNVTYTDRAVEFSQYRPHNKNGAMQYIQHPQVGTVAVDSNKIHLYVTNYMETEEPLLIVTDGGTRYNTTIAAYPLVSVTADPSNGYDSIDKFPVNKDISVDLKSSDTLVKVYHGTTENESNLIRTQLLADASSRPPIQDDTGGGSGDTGGGNEGGSEMEDKQWAISGSLLTALGKAFRDILGTNETYTLTQMKDKVYEAGELIASGGSSAQPSNVAYTTTNVDKESKYIKVTFSSIPSNAIFAAVIPTNQASTDRQPSENRTISASGWEDYASYYRWYNNGILGINGFNPSQLSSGSRFVVNGNELQIESYNSDSLWMTGKYIVVIVGSAS